MLPETLRIALCKLSMWLAANRPAGGSACPVPFSEIPGQIQAFLESRQAGASLAALALVVAIHAMRSVKWQRPGSVE
jgi:hypothetical protein